MTKRERIVEALRRRELVSEIAQREGVVPGRVSRIAHEEGIEREKVKRGPRKLEDRTTHLGPLHYQIGLDLFFYRTQYHPTSLPELADRLCMSRTNLQQAERGYYEFKLRDLIKIAEVICGSDDRLPKDLAELMTERSNKVRAA